MRKPYFTAVSYMISSQEDQEAQEVLGVQAHPPCLSLETDRKHSQSQSGSVSVEEVSGGRSVTLTIHEAEGTLSHLLDAAPAWSSSRSWWTRRTRHISPHVLSCPQKQTHFSKSSHGLGELNQTMGLAKHSHITHGAF